MLSADLLLKGLGGLAVVGGATTVGVCYQQEKWIFAKKKVEILTLKELAEKVGLDCKKTNTEPTAAVGVECSKKTGEGEKNIKVKKDNETFDVSNLPATGGGKIKVYKTSEGEKYNNDFKFVIEEADVSATATGASATSNKLEEFETYEIKKEGDVWSLTRKDKALVLKSKLLGLSGVDTCKLPEKDAETGTCSNLTAEDLKKIKFDGKTDGSEVTINDSGADNNISLKISKTSDVPFNTGGYKFVLETNKNISVPKSSGAITIKKGTNTEFKLKATPKSGSPKTLTLEKAWTLEELIKKVGIASCTTPSGGTTPKECTFTTSTKVNLFNDASNYTKQATVKNEDASKKIKVEEDQENHNQGFKFYVAEESSEITLENGNPNKGNDKKISKKDNNGSPTYEIKQQTVEQGGAKDWYLSKVTNSPGGA